MGSGDKPFPVLNGVYNDFTIQKTQILIHAFLPNQKKVASAIGD